MRIFYSVLLLLLLIVGCVIITYGARYVASLRIPSGQFGLVSLSFKEGSMVFAPDIMLGRSVELMMDKNGTGYPFEELAAFIRGKDVAVANFEATVPEKHDPTPSGGMRFSVREEFLDAVHDAGFDVLSLANNHALDHGEDAYFHTRAACHAANLLCIGHPLHVNPASAAMVTAGDTRIGIIAIHTLYGELSTTTLATLIETMRATTDVQFAFIHWGDEYARFHNDAQEELAHFLVDNGIDAVIGHHPHVMQDIERYHGKPIFYSLGNFIFDQYFETAVEEGYLVSVDFSRKDITYTLTPYDSHAEHAQPRIMDSKATETTLETLMAPGYFRDEEIRSGSFTVSR